MRPAFIAKTARNKKSTYPHQEVVLPNCTLENIDPKGYTDEDELLQAAHLWEFNSTDADGNPIDTSQRNKYSRQLDPIRDAQLIGKYSNAQCVLGGNP